MHAANPVWCPDHACIWWSTANSPLFGCRLWQKPLVSCMPDASRWKAAMQESLSVLYMQGLTCETT